MTLVLGLMQYLINDTLDYGRWDYLYSIEKSDDK